MDFNQGQTCANICLKKKKIYKSVCCSTLSITADARVCQVRSLFSHESGLEGNSELPQTASASQSKSSNQAASPPSAPDGPRACLSPVEETLGGTVVPPENLKRSGKKTQPTEGGGECGGGAAAEHKDSCILYLPPLTNHILFCNTLNQITYLMNKMCFHSKSNILISQIQYLRQYLPILEVNR